MGRGRAKAKQTKVARDLKYRTHETDFGALARELHGETDSDAPTTTVDDPTARRVVGLRRAVVATDRTRRRSAIARSTPAPADRPC